MKIITTTILAFSLALAAPLSAQDTATDTPAAKADEAFPVDAAQPTIKPPFVREKHGAWDVTCTEIDGAEQCKLYHLFIDSEGNSVAELTMEVLPEGSQAAAGVTFVSPLLTLLTAQMSWRVDAAKNRRYPFNWCENAGCFARFGLTPADVTALKKGANATITVVSIVNPQKPIELTLPLTGFTAAFNSIPAPAK
jgi:invasion protein IalB